MSFFFCYEWFQSHRRGEVRITANRKLAQFRDGSLAHVKQCPFCDKPFYMRVQGHEIETPDGREHREAIQAR